MREKVVYSCARLFDLWGIGEIEGIVEIEKRPMIKINFKKALFPFVQFLPLEEFERKIERREIEFVDEENEKFYEIKEKERSLISLPFSHAKDEVFKILETNPELGAKLIDLLIERISDPERINREIAALILGEIVPFSDLPRTKKVEILKLLLKKAKEISKPSDQKIGRPDLQAKKRMFKRSFLLSATKIALSLEKKTKRKVVLEKVLSSLKQQVVSLSTVWKILAKFYLFPEIKIEIKNSVGVNLLLSSSILIPENWEDSPENFYQLLSQRIGLLFTVLKEAKKIETLSEFAQILKIKKSTLYGWLSGKSRPGKRFLEFLTKFDLTIEEFTLSSEREFRKLIKEKIIPYLSRSDS